MEKKKTSILLFVQFLFNLCNVQHHACPSHSSKDLSCYNDFNHTIDCVWISSDSFDSANNECEILAEYSHPNYSPFKASCDLKSLSVTTSTVKNCSLIFDTDYTFDEHDELSISVHCNHVKELNMTYVPRCHVKVSVGKPVVNISTISWFFDHGFINVWSYELQWKQHNQLWSDASKNQDHQDNGEFKVDLPQQNLIRGEKYEARVRMKSNEEGFLGTWSDWSPTVSWVSPVGRSGQPTAFAVSFWEMTVVGVAVVVLMLIVVLHRKDKTIWVYLVKKIQGAPVPNPANSFLQKVFVVHSTGVVVPHGDTAELAESTFSH
ncbi:interleukin-4 receptor subunit alpha isoform X2 [Gouania willdenowi]|uniref:interleukin-4 receptor subunit alpha isoform X2 n=1 Tax=Gouania willdenowi TaxID=441366 RepID=UPI001056308B|nr:interleukin-4 receptor subunit alpha-like isoform X2 [Gouania willdenowi]